jgi:hypothetical protein
MARDYEGAYMRLLGERRVDNGAKSSILLPGAPSFTLDAS